MRAIALIDCLFIGGIWYRAQQPPRTGDDSHWFTEMPLKPPPIELYNKGDAPLHSMLV